MSNSAPLAVMGSMTAPYRPASTIPVQNYKLRQALVALVHGGPAAVLTEAEHLSFVKRGFLVNGRPTPAAEAEVRRMGLPLKKTGAWSFQEEGVSRNITIGRGGYSDRSEYLAPSTDGRHAYVRDHEGIVRMIRTEDVPELLKGRP